MDQLYVGTHGHVLALDKQSGESLWATSLPASGYQVVSIIHEDGLLFCGSGGHVYGLDPADGSILWSNDLPGMGHGRVYLATARSSTPAILPAADGAAAEEQSRHTNHPHA